MFDGWKNLNKKHKILDICHKRAVGLQGKNSDTDLSKIANSRLFSAVDSVEMDAGTF